MKTHRWEILAVVFILAVASLMTPVRSSAFWVDPVTASIRRQATWFAIPGPEDIDRTEIERWIIRREGQHASSWKFCSRAYKTIWGATRARGCSTGPPVMPLRDGETNARFVRASSDEEMAAFIRVMRTGTDAEQRQAVDAALAKILGR